MRRYAPGTKVQQLCEQLRDLALKLGPEAKMPILRDLYTLLDTNQVMLNEALNQLEAQQILYRRRGSGIYVSPYIYRKSICVLLNSHYLLSMHTSPFWGMLWAQLAQFAEQRTTHLNHQYLFHLVVPSPTQEVSLPEEVKGLIESERLSGVISIGLDYENGEWLRNHNIPCVAFAQYSPWTINQDYIELFRLALHSLKQQGCQHIGIWNGINGPISPPQTPGAVIDQDTFWQHYFNYESYYLLGRVTTENPDEYFRTIFAEHQLVFHPELMRGYMEQYRWYDTMSRLSFQEQGYRATYEVFSSGNRVKPDGLIVLNDMLMDGALSAFEELDIHIGKTVKIATHANTGSPILYRRSNQLTTVEFDPMEIVQAAYTLLDDLLANADLPPRVKWITPRLTLPTGTRRQRHRDTW